MPVLTLPPRTTEVLGEEAAVELAQWVTETVALRDESVHRDEYRGIASRLDILEHDVSGLKTAVTELRRTMNTRFDAMEERFDARFDRMQGDVNARFDRMQGDVNARFDAMNARFDAVNARIDTIHDVVRSQTRWLVGTLIALGGLISVLITVFEFIH